MNKASAVQKMEDYMHLVKLMNNVDEVLKKTENDITTIKTPPGEVTAAKDSSICGRKYHGKNLSIFTHQREILTKLSNLEGVAQKIGLKP